MYTKEKEFKHILHSARRRLLQKVTRTDTSVDHAWNKDLVLKDRVVFITDAAHFCGYV